MRNTEIDWTQNCLTGGIHKGRNGALWPMPLGYAVHLYDFDTLKDIVIARIYSDAKQLIENNDKYDLAWADKIKENAEKAYYTTFQSKLDDLGDYYNSAIFRNDHKTIVRLVEEDKLNPGFEPLHSHDTINLLCRIIGVQAIPMKYKVPTE